METTSKGLEMSGKEEAPALGGIGETAGEAGHIDQSSHGQGLACPGKAWSAGNAAP